MISENKLLNVIFSNRTPGIPPDACRIPSESEANPAKDQTNLPRARRVTKHSASRTLERHHYVYPWCIMYTHDASWILMLHHQHSGCTKGTTQNTVGFECAPPSLKNNHIQATSLCHCSECNDERVQFVIAICSLLVSWCYHCMFMSSHHASWILKSICH